jgi:hypothetical protein
MKTKGTPQAFNVGFDTFVPAPMLGTDSPALNAMVTQLVAPCFVDGGKGGIPHGGLLPMSPFLFVGVVQAVSGFGGTSNGTANMMPLYNPATNLKPIGKQQ